MGQLGTLAGMNGLAKGVDKVAESQRNLASLQAVEQTVQKQKAESIVMQQMEAQQYEEIQKQASELLERDRANIQLKSLSLQKNIRAKIEEYGSRKAFFAAGGTALLSQYKSDLLTSDEFMLYKDNKNNMATILKIKESGKTLNKVDEQNLINYNLGLSNKITYTGIKNTEIEIPSNEYDYGTVIPPQVILHKGSNYMKIYSNFLLDHPDQKNLKGDDLEIALQEYTLREHGANRGLDHTNDKLRLSQRDAAAKRANATDAKETPKSLVNGAVNGMNSLRDNKTVPLTLDNLFTKDYFTRANMASGNKHNKFFGDAYVTTATKAPSTYLSAQGWDRPGEGISRLFNEETTFRLAHARKAFPLSTNKITEALYGAVGEGGTVVIKPDTTDFYQGNGDRLTKDNLAYEDTSAVVQSYVFAPYDPQSGKMIVEPLDHNGKPYSYSDKSRKQIMDEHKKLYTGQPEYSMFAVLKNSNGDIIYQKHDINKFEGNTKIASAIGADVDNLNPIIEENKARDEVINEKRQEIKNNETIIKGIHQQAKAQNGIFSSEEAVQEAQSLMYNGNNRTDLYQAYNLAQASMLSNTSDSKGFNQELEIGVKNREFTSQINQYPKLQSAIINNKAYSDIDFMDIFAKELAEGDAQDYTENKAFAEVWKEIYGVITKKS